MQPRHFVENRGQYHALIDTYFTPLDKRSVRQLKRCIDKPSNRLWDDYLYAYVLGGRKLNVTYEEPWLFEGFPYREIHDPDEIYIPFSDKVQCPGRNQVTGRY